MENTSYSRCFMAVFHKRLVSCFSSSAFLQIAKTLKTKKIINV